MKLNPEDLDIVSFPTAPHEEAAVITIGQQITDPTPDSRCFVCD